MYNMNWGRWKGPFAVPDVDLDVLVQHRLVVGWVCDRDELYGAINSAKVNNYIHATGCFDIRVAASTPTTSI